MKILPVVVIGAGILTTPCIETYVGVVHPWMRDAMGHLNVRHLSVGQAGPQGTVAIHRV